MVAVTVIVKCRNWEGHDVYLFEYISVYQEWMSETTMYLDSNSEFRENHHTDLLSAVI